MNNMTTKIQDGNIIVYLSGRIDSTNSPDIEKELIEDVERSGGAVPVFDMSDLSYISSAGLRVLMRIRKNSEDALKVVNVSSEIYEIFDTTGLTELFDVSKKMREISVDGCEIIGKGFYGTVYRIDDDTIVKAYESADSLSMIQNEKKLAKIALVAGVPTAISYDIVRIGDSYGSVFELLRAKTFNDLLIEQPENSESIIKKYAEFLRLIHSRVVPPGRLVSAKEKFMKYLEVASVYLPADIYSKVKAMFEEIPELHNVIHGDAQMKNVMLGDGEPMLIDMDTLSEGHPIFDLQSLYVTYFAFGEDNPDNSRTFLGISNELVANIWERSIGYYFGTDDEKRISELRDKISVAGCIRFLFLIDGMGEYEKELFDIRVKHTVEHLQDLLTRVDTLLF